MALQRRWFRHARRDFGIFASLGIKRIGTWPYFTLPWVIGCLNTPLLGTKRIGTWPYFTLPWVIGCLNTPLCLISLLTFYFLGDIPFHPLPLLLKWTRLRTWTPQPLGLGSLQKRHFYSGGLCPWPWRTCPLHNIKTPYGMHTHKVAITNLR